MEEQQEGVCCWAALCSSSFHRVHTAGADCPLGIATWNWSSKYCSLPSIKGVFHTNIINPASSCSSQVVSVLYWSFIISFPWCSIDSNKFCCSHIVFTCSCQITKKGRKKWRKEERERERKEWLAKICYEQVTHTLLELQWTFADECKICTSLKSKSSSLKNYLICRSWLFCQNKWLL